MTFTEGNSKQEAQPKVKIRRNPPQPLQTVWTGTVLVLKIVPQQPLLKTPAPCTPPLTTPLHTTETVLKSPASFSTRMSTEA